MKAEMEMKTWPVLPMAICYVVGLLSYFTFVPLLDGSNGSRFLFFLGISALYWLRTLVAVVRRERNKTYWIYISVVLLSPVIWIALETIWRTRYMK